MPTLQDNLQDWNEWYAWTEEGDEWSREWGGVAPLWFGTLLPRLRSFVPTGTILEIAPGYGRWTQFLTKLATRVVLVDVSPNCIDYCKKRFAEDERIEYYVNDGRSLEMVADDSIDLAFSFDSLVHAEIEVLVAYLAQLAHKL